MRIVLAAGILAAFLPVFATLTGAADGVPLPAGQIVESVACSEDPGQTYSIYLPSTYTPDRNWPVIYSFDPGARGVLPVQRLQAAAERFGYIVIGSNVSRNFEPKLSLAAANAMWADSHVRLAIDSRRVYTLGFSGGARLAAGLAVVSQDFAGVIACGAAFDPKHLPRDGRPALFAGIVGLEDMNYPELRDAENRLRDARVPYRLFFFDGGHDWPPADIFLEVLAWLRVRAIRAGAEVTDPVFLQAECQRLSESAERAWATGRPLEAGRIYAALIEDFSGVLDTDYARARLEQLRGESAYRQAEKKERRLRLDENGWLVKLDGRFVRIRNTPMSIRSIDNAVNDWCKQIAGFRHRRDTSRDADERSLYHRLHEFVWRRAYEEAVLFARQQEYVRAALLLEIARCGRPDDPNLLFSLGKAYARLQEEERAVRWLSEAVNHGFQNPAAWDDPALAGLDHSPAFQALRQRITSGSVKP